MMFLKFLLQNDYALSIWFSKRKKTISGGTVYLFNIKLTFVILLTYMLITKSLVNVVNTKILSIFSMLTIFILLKSLNNIIKRKIYFFDIKKEYDKLTRPEIIKRRVFGLIIISLFYALFFVIVLPFYS